ncbi:protein FAR1-related sequence 5, partial [Tanacetum coccineum]
FMDSSHSSARSSVSQNSVSSDVVVESFVPSGTVLNAFTEEIVAYEKDIDETHAIKSKWNCYYIPKVSANVLLVKGNVYDSVDDCVVAYMKYAAEAGMGCPKGIHVDTLDLGNNEKQKRNSNLHITGCKARAVFNLDTRTRKFVLKVFDTIHNHELEREEYKHLSKTERQLTYMEQAFIVKPASVNIGATRAHHFLTGIKGSYLLFHGSTVDFKNFFRSVNCYIGDSDAQMLIHKMENRKKYVSDFSFDYLVENVELFEIFWADEVSKYNYRELCAYKMVFVPFTAIDNHMKCDMCKKSNDDTDFKRGSLNKIVWNMYIGPEEFEYKWGKLMEEFKLENHKWLTKMFNIRSTWIPSYFIDSSLCGLMRTTSRSESENSFFSHFTNSGSTLMNFENCFETAMEKQRHVQERMDHKTIDTVPKLKNFLKIERHASNVYTRSLFELVRKEIFVGLWHCQIDSKSLVEGSEVLQNVGNGQFIEFNPQQYILRRWTKNLIPPALRNKRNIYGEKNVVVENCVNEATSIVDHCVHLLSKDEPSPLKKRIEADCPNPPSKTKLIIGAACWSSKPPTVDVNNPTFGSTKGTKRHAQGRFEVQDESVFQKEVCQQEVVVQKEVCQEEIVQEKVDFAEDEEELVQEDEDLIHE